MINLSNKNAVTIDEISNNSVIITFCDKSYYIGDKNNSVKYGKYFGEKYNYYGNWLNNEPNNKGILVDKVNNIRYNGTFKKGFAEGFGREKYNNGYSYEGNFLKGKKNGTGKMLFNNNVIYEGIWFNNTILTNNTNVSIFSKEGNVLYKSKNIEFKNNEFYVNGYAIEYYSNNKIKYKGNLLDNKYDGFGKLYYLENNNYWKIYEGMFENNMFNGKGTLFNQDGSNYFVGNFLNNLIDSKYVSILDKTTDNIFYFEGVVDNFELKKEFYYPIIHFKEGSYIDYLNNYIFRGEFKKYSLDKKKLLYFYRLHSSKKCIIEKIKCENLNIIDKKLIFEGTMDNDIFSGTLFLNNKLKFTGKFSNKNFYQKNKIFNKIFDKVSYLNGILSTYENVKISEGDYKNNLLNGSGKLYRNGILRSSGYYINNSLNGDGITYYSNGNIEYRGKFYRGYRHGNGILYDNNNNIVFNGFFYYNNPSN